MKEKIIDLSLEFTRVYRQMKDASAAMREAHAVRTLYPGLLLPPEEGDMPRGKRMLIQSLSVIAFMAIVILVVLGSDFIANLLKALFTK